MAIAPLEDTRAPAPQGAAPLRLIPGGRPPRSVASGAAIHARREPVASIARSMADHPTAHAVGGPMAVALAVPIVAAPKIDPSERARRQAAIRAQTLSRRRRTVAVLASVLAVGLLAVPVRALGAVTVSGQETPGAVPAGLADGSRYVVQPGDTIHSIALRINPAAASALARQLARSTGSWTVVPGETVVIP